MRSILYQTKPPDAGTLAGLTRQLDDDLTAPRHYIPGKTKIRDTIMEILACSASDAEALTDALEARGFIAFSGSPRQMEGAPHSWSFHPHPESVTPRPVGG
ncbi:hypothetical protein [Haliangium sp.]|uniref:hypothetical protein n=1 Tax=Haliangium sp. TaxID=2663208 RepID=UPI003D10A267